MSHHASVEQVISIASRLKEQVQGLFDAYTLLPAVIEKEHRAIRSSDFSEVEAARIEKESLGEKIETCFSGMTVAGEQLADYRSGWLEQPKTRPATLRECVQVLTELTQAEEAKDFAGSVLKHLVDGLQVLLNDFEKLYRQVKPVIEGNKYLVQSMLHNFQESYRFWQEISEKVQTSYNSQGVQNTQGKNSGFAVKA